jgi:hypothetical protein
MPDKSDIGQLVGSITSDVKRIAGGEMALAKSELKPTWDKSTTDIKFLLGGAVAGLLGAIAATTAIALALALAFSDRGLSAFASAALGFAIPAVFFIGVGGPLALLHWRKVKAHLRSAAATLSRVGSDTGQALTALHDGITHGQELVDAGGRRS